MTDEQFEALNGVVQEILRKQAELEQRLSRLESVTRPGDVTASVPAPRSVEPPRPSPAISPKPLPAAARPTRPIASDSPAIESKVGLTLVNRIGVITLILGVAFFFKWAVDNEWIGPTGRVLLGLLAGLLMLGAADVLFRKAQKTFAQGIAGAGLAILYLAAYAAFGFYHLVPQSVAFLFLLSTTVLGFALSLRYDSSAIAALGLLGGYITPLLLSTGEDHPWFLLSYVLLLSGAAMDLRRRKGWRVLEFLPIFATTIIYFAWFFDHEGAHRETAVATLGALAYYALFAYGGSDIIAALSAAIASLEILCVWANASGPFFALELLIAASAIYLARSRRRPLVLTVAFASFWLCAGFFSWTAQS